MKTISYKDISKMAKVSISTVSRYYNNGYVSKKTKEKIERVVQQFEYYPNHGARLIRGRDNSIFVIIPEWPQGVYMSISNGIVQAAKIHNKKVNTTFTEITTKEYIETVRYVLSWRPTSIVLFVPDYDPELFNYLKTIEDTTVVVYGHEVPGLNWIKVDEVNAFYQLTSTFYHSLIDNKKMIFVVDPKLNVTQAKERSEGFKRACLELGIEHEIYSLQGKNKNAVSEFNRWTRKKGYSNIVCSTHEIFISLNVLGDKSLRLTDIGYQSVYDYIKTYKAKVFVDYPSIGLEIENMIWVHNVDFVLKNKLIKTRVIN